MDNYDLKPAYLAFCGSGTASGAMVKGSPDYFMDAIESMPVASEKEKQVDFIVQEEAVRDIQGKETTEIQEDISAEEEVYSTTEPKQGRKRREDTAYYLKVIS